MYPLDKNTTLPLNIGKKPEKQNNPLSQKIRALWSQQPKNDPVRPPTPRLERKVTGIDINPLIRLNHLKNYDEIVQISTETTPDATIQKFISHILDREDHDACIPPILQKYVKVTDAETIFRESSVPLLLLKSYLLENASFQLLLPSIKIKGRGLNKRAKNFLNSFDKKISRLPQSSKIILRQLRRDLAQKLESDQEAKKRLASIIFIRIVNPYILEKKNDVPLTKLLQGVVTGNYENEKGRDYSEMNVSKEQFTTLHNMMMEIIEKMS